MRKLLPLLILALLLASALAACVPKSFQFLERKSPETPTTSESPALQKNDARHPPQAILPHLDETLVKLKLGKSRIPVLKLYTDPDTPSFSHAEFTDRESLLFLQETRGEWAKLRAVSPLTGKELLGWLKSYKLIYPDGSPLEYDRLKEEKEAKERTRKEAEEKREKELAKQARKQARKQAIANYPLSVQRCIREKNVCFGMDIEAVLLSWGSPERKHKTVYPDIVRQQWVYGRTYLYFVNGILTNWQTSE